jgi:hypothetical protein
MKWAAAIFIFLMLGSQGCGLVVHGSTQDLQINTIPQGATVTIGMQSCVTPCMLKAQRTSQTMFVEKGTYKRTFDMEKDFNFGTTICGNVLWLLPGAIIDIAAGSAWEIRPINLRLDASD